MQVSKSMIRIQRSTLVLQRYFHVPPAVLNDDKLAFYKLVGKNHSRSKTDGEISKSSSFTFETLKKTEKPLYSTEDIFGTGKTKATKSSRRDVSYRLVNKVICGLTVPKKPIEPDNCCMSGCINCVWELFNEDLEEWKLETQRAVDALIAQGDDIKEKWPLDFDAPPKSLPDKYIPDELLKSNTKREDTKVNMPLGLQVFASLEKKLKNKTSFPLDHTLEHTSDTSVRSDIPDPTSTSSSSMSRSI